MTQPCDLPTADKDALIAALIARNEALMAEVTRLSALAAEVTRLAARVAELEAKLGLPPKTPGNSSVPPSKGQKPSGASAPKAKSKPHDGAHRPLHPNPTSKRDVLATACSCCGADVSSVAQEVSEVYDRVEIPKVEPDVTRVSLFGGVCPCCAKRFKATPPPGLEPGSPFGPNLRAFVIYLRAVQGIPLARLRDVMSDLFGLDISEGALVNILAASTTPFKSAVAAIKARLLAGTTIASDETGLPVGKANWWLWVFHHGDSAVFVAEPKPPKGYLRWHGDEAARSAVYANRARLKSSVGREPMRLRGEIVERSFAHTLERGSMRRTWLRGRDNVHKRYLIHIAGYNLGLLLRALCGVGTPRELAALNTATVFVVRTDEDFVLVAAAMLDAVPALLVVAVTPDAA